MFVGADEKNSDAEETEKPKAGNLRKNIREVMDETKLDEATLAAQSQEKERLRRVQEQLRANRDVSSFESSFVLLSIFSLGRMYMSYELNSCQPFSMSAHG